MTDKHCTCHLCQMQNEEDLPDWAQILIHGLRKQVESLERQQAASRTAERYDSLKVLLVPSRVMKDLGGSVRLYALTNNEPYYLATVTPDESLFLGRLKDLNSRGLDHTTDTEADTSSQ